MTGIPDARTEIVMLRAPGGGTGVELSSFQHPDPVGGNNEAMANELGLRSIAFEVVDIESVVQRLGEAGYGLVGGIGSWQDAWRMAYVRGPEGITVAVAEQIG